MTLSTLDHLLRLASSLSSKPPTLSKRASTSVFQSISTCFPDHHSVSLSGQDHSFDHDHQLRLILTMLYQAHQFSSALKIIPSNPLSPCQTAALDRCFAISSNNPSTPALPFSIAPQYLARFASPNHLIANLKRILSVCALNCLHSIHAQLSSLPPASSDQPPLLGSRDVKAIQGLAQTVANWGIYNLLASHTSIYLGLPPAHTQTLTRFEALEDEVDCFAAVGLQNMVQSLIQIFLPPPEAQTPSNTLAHPILQPAFALQSALLPTLFVPLVAGLITLRLTPASAQLANEHLDRLLDLTNPKTVFTSLLSLRASPHGGACQSASESDFRTHVSQILSKRLARPSGLRGLLQAVMSDDYNDDDDDGQPAKTTSATLNRLDSLYLIISSCPAGLEHAEYFDRVLRTLVEMVVPGFFASKDSHREGGHGPADSLRRAACYVLSQMIVNQTTVFGAHLSPIIHAPLRLSLRRSCAGPDAFGVLVPAAEIRQSVRLMNELVVNSDPSPRLIERLVMPVLPQLVSLVLFLLKTKAEPELRVQIDGLVVLWIKMSELGRAAEWIRRSVRELESGRELQVGQRDETDKRRGCWARDAEGAVCVRVKEDEEEDPMMLCPDPEGLAIWLESLKIVDLVGLLLVKWLDDLEALKGRLGFTEAKMSLFRMQVILKVIENMDCSQIQDPVHILNFIKHSLTSTTKRPMSTVRNQKPPVQMERIGLASLRHAGENEEGDEEDGEGGENERAILVAGLTLLLSVIEANPSMDERKMPVLQEITKRLDELLLAQDPTMLSGEVHELGMQCRLMLSVRSALAKVDSLSCGAASDGGSRAEEEASGLRKQYTEGLALVQDACVPLRSQGIAMLKEVLLSRPQSRQASELVDSLSPNVVEVLFRLIEQDDSFVYLNAVKALSGLAEKYSGIVCERLNKGYGEALEGGLQAREALDEGSSRIDVDRRLRIGEAMVQVIQRAGSALPLYIDKLLPSLLVAFHSSAFPAAVRASAVTILTSCVEASFSTMGVHVAELVESCLAVLSTQSYARPRAENDENESEDEEDPTRAGAAHPVLRRAAILFVLGAFTQAADAYGNVYARAVGRLGGTVERVLGYVGAVDADGVVREQALAAGKRIREMGWGV